MANSEPVLSVRNLEVAFPTRRRTLTAVDRVSFDIAPGEVLGVVGESGAGKSLTGAAVIGLLEPPGRIMGGEVRLQGRRIDNLRPEEMRKLRGRHIGMVFQDPLTSLNPLYRIGDQIIETIRTHSRLSEAQARERSVALLQEAGIQGARARIDSYPHDGARRVDPGADHHAVEAALPGAGHRGDADHSRHGRDRRDRRPRGRDVRRPHRRDWPRA
jgi:peptide/nickel transport system ATP-binding protein